MTQNSPNTNRWIDGTMFTSTSDLSAECIERYIQRGRTMRATAFRAMIKGESGAEANDTKRATLKNCASRFAPNPQAIGATA
jgi:hypothetical protein